MLSNVLTSSELIQKFNSDDFQFSVFQSGDQILKKNYGYIYNSKNISDDVKAFLVLKMMGNQQDRLDGIRSKFVEEAKNASIFIKNRETFQKGELANDLPVFIQEITAQRFVAYLTSAMAAKVLIFQIDCIEQNKSIKEESEKLEENIRYKLDRIESNQVISEEESNSRKDFELMISLFSVSDKIKFHAWAVILFVEAAWRTTIETIAYTIHLMAPTYFENYSIEDREKMVVRHFQSLLVMGAAIFSLSAACQVDSESFVMEDLKIVKRGTAFDGKSIPTGWTSDFYPLVTTKA
jgi:hypothetical protein